MKNQTTRRDFLKVSAAACAAPIAALSGKPEALSAPCSDGLTKLSASDVLTWGKDPIEARTSQCATICLNGIRQAMPADEATAVARV
jgi:anaerobic selenocysteine-containing dehydrogenase